MSTIPLFTFCHTCMERKHTLFPGTQELPLITLFKIYSYYDIQDSVRFSDILVEGVNANH